MNEATVENAAVVYLVDDDYSVRRSLKRLLRSAGIEAETFTSAEEFLARKPCLEGCCLILDIRLGGRSGLELQEHLCSAGRDGCPPIIFITADHTAAIRERALGRGAHGFFTKPVDPEGLLEAVETVLGTA